MSFLAVDGRSDPLDENPEFQIVREARLVRSTRRGMFLTVSYHFLTAVARGVTDTLKLRMSPIDFRLPGYGFPMPILVRTRKGAAANADLLFVDKADISGGRCLV